MMHIRPVSDLRNKFPDIERVVQEGEPVYLTKNGYGTMVVLSLEAYSKLVEPEEYLMDTADAAADSTDVRLNHDEVFKKIRRELNA